MILSGKLLIVDLFLDIFASRRKTMSRSLIVQPVALLHLAFPKLITRENHGTAIVQLVSVDLSTIFELVAIKFLATLFITLCLSKFLSILVVY